jgi:GT2 family glycosyltransferase
VLPSATPVISFVIPVRDDAQRLQRCLESIRASIAGVAAEVIVADNGSTDDSMAVGKAAGARVVSFPNQRVSEVRNQAARLAHGRHIAFVDADHELARGWVAAAVDLLSDPSVTAVGAQYRAPVDGTWVQRAYDLLRRHRPGTRTTDWLPSGNIVVRRDAFDGIGGFDTSLETCEDVDLSQRLTSSGGRLVASDRLTSIHRGDPKTLKALFLGELWRGRDNLRVSLRGPLTLRTLVGISLTVANLVALMSIPIGIITWPMGGRTLVLMGLAFLLFATLLRSLSLLWTASAASGGIGSAIQVLVVTAVYDVARALALVTRAGHSVRRKT